MPSIAPIRQVTVFVSPLFSVPAEKMMPPVRTMIEELSIFMGGSIANTPIAAAGRRRGYLLSRTQARNYP